MAKSLAEQIEEVKAAHSRTRREALELALESRKKSARRRAEQIVNDLVKLVADALERGKSSFVLYQDHTVPDTIRTGDDVSGQLVEILSAEGLRGHLFVSVAPANDHDVPMNSLCFRI